MSIFADVKREKEEMTQKEHIVEQTMQMLVQQGIKSVRMDDIAQQLGVSKRTLYELFGDKEGLLYLSMECYFTKSRECQMELSSGARNVLEGLYMVLGNVMDKSEQTWRMVENLRKFYPSVYDKIIHEGFDANRRNLHEMLEKGISDGLFVETFNLDLAIAVFFQTATALVTHHNLFLPEGLSQREAFVQIISTFFRGISTEKGMRLVDDYMRQYHPHKTNNNQ